jgi:hypothetical protein
MKLVLFISLLFSLSLAEYEKGKIDMHGGKEYHEYEKKRDFQSPSFGMKMFLDKNATKQTKPTQK